MIYSSYIILIHNLTSSSCSSAAVVVAETATTSYQIWYEMGCCQEFACSWSSSVADYSAVELVDTID